MAGATILRLYCLNRVKIDEDPKTETWVTVLPIAFTMSLCSVLNFHNGNASVLISSKKFDFVFKFCTNLMQSIYFDASQMFLITDGSTRLLLIVSDFAAISWQVTSHLLKLFLIRNMSDGTRRKLTLPPWHTPYLEKHKIMELFHELAREIVIQQPADHLMFTKQLLYRAAKNIGVSRVLMLTSPKINCLEVAKQIAEQTGQFVVTEDQVLRHLHMVTTRIMKLHGPVLLYHNLQKAREQIRPGALAMCLAYLLHTEEAQNHGWILVDCIKSAKEAKRIVHAGIIPTHVLHLIPPFNPPLHELLYSNVHATWPEYRREITAIRDVFKHKLVEVFLRQRCIYDVVKECVEIVKISKRIECPRTVRLVLLGPRGSGRNTQAKLLAKKLNLIHVDFQYLLCQVYNSSSELGKALQECKEEVCYHSDLLGQVVNQRILEDDCLVKGWVLTGYPFTVTDFKYLDVLDTAPNRVVFLECDLNVCRERLINRRVNFHTGSITDIVQRPENVHLKHLAIHPKDKTDLVNAELNFYCENYGALRNYCGETAQVVNADQPERWVTECILACVTRGTLAAPLRNPMSEITTPQSSSTFQI